MKAYKSAAIRGGKTVRLGSNLNLVPPTNLVSSFDVPTISGVLGWTNNAGATAKYEVYSSTNGAADVLLATTAVGATSYQDTTCEQNASVVYKIKPKIAAKVGDLVTATVLATPLCFKSDQSILSPATISALNISVGKSVTVDWGDGTSQVVSGNNSSITKNYAVTGQYNISFSGDLNFIINFTFSSQIKLYGNVSNFILPNSANVFSLRNTSVTGALSNAIIPAMNTTFAIYSTNISGSLPQINFHPSNSMSYQAHTANISDSNVTVFRKAMTVFNVGSQNVVFPTVNIDKLLKAAADWYQVNAPTANCTFTMNGANMGIPTGGASNIDITRLVGYYTAVGMSCTVLVRTS